MIADAAGSRNRKRDGVSGVLPLWFSLREPIAVTYPCDLVLIARKTVSAKAQCARS